MQKQRISSTKACVRDETISNNRNGLKYWTKEKLVVLPAWRHSLIYQLFREMADSVTRLPRRAGMFAPGRPVAKVGAPRWDVDIVRIPLRAPQATFGVEHPWTTAVLGLDEDD